MRKEKGLSQLQLAEEINVSRQAISRWEVGLAVPSREKLRALSELYNVSVDYLLSDKTAEDMQKKFLNRKMKQKKNRQTIYGGPNGLRCSYIAGCGGCYAAAFYITLISRKMKFQFRNGNRRR